MFSRDSRYKNTPLCNRGVLCSAVANMKTNPIVKPRSVRPHTRANNNLQKNSNAIPAANPMNPFVPGRHLQNCTRAGSIICVTTRNYWYHRPNANRVSRSGLPLLQRGIIAAFSVIAAYLRFVNTLRDSESSLAQSCRGLPPAKVYKGASFGRYEGAAIQTK